MARNTELTLKASQGKAPDNHSGSIFFVGTATVILTYGDLTIITDPNFLHAGDHAHLGYGLTSKRLTNPAIDISELPELDFCILSHYHGDHFDHLCEKKLDKDLPIVTNRHAASVLERKGFRRTERLHTWQTIKVTKGETRLGVTSMPGRHGPGFMDALLPDVMGSMLSLGSEEGSSLYLYISGDTLVFEGLREIAQRFPEIDISLLHLGGTRILNLFKVTMDGNDGVQLMRLLKPRRTLPIHYNDYTVFKDPLDNFKRAVEKAGFEDSVTYLHHGDTFRFDVPGTSQRDVRQRAS